MHQAIKSPYKNDALGLPKFNTIASKQMKHTNLLVSFLGFCIVSSSAIADETPSSFSNAITIQTEGCDPGAGAPIPGTQNLFVARHFFNKDGSLLSDACSPEIWKQQVGLVLQRLDWDKQQLTVVKPLLPVPLTVKGSGPFKGLIVTAAYDPSVIKFHNKYLVTFECGFGNAPDYKIRGVASCVAPFDLKKKQIVSDKLYVAVSGEYDQSTKTLYSASVPTFLVANGRLYLYWSVVRQDRDQASSTYNKFLDQSVRGAELVSDKNGYFWVKGVKGMAYSTDPDNTVEVWAPDENSPMSDASVDIKALWTHGNKIIALATLGGRHCVVPGFNSPGCYRMVLAEADSPLGEHIFNKSPHLDDADLPTNPVNYIVPILTPEGNYAFIGHFFYPHSNNTYSNLRLMPPQDHWPSDVAPLKTQVTIFPFTDKDLWPTGDGSTAKPQ